MTDPKGSPFQNPEPLTLTEVKPRELETAPLSRSREPPHLLDRYQRLLETITDYVYMVRVENGRVVETHHGVGCIAITGYSSQEFANDPLLWIQMVHPADRTLVGDLGQRILAGEEVTPIEHRILHKNGNQRWVSNTPILKHDETGRLVGYDGIVRDITDHKRNVLALQEIREQQQRAGQLLTTILSHTFMAAVYLDTEGTCLWVNETFAKSSELPANFFPGKNLFALHPELSIRHTFTQVVKTGEPLIGSALTLVFPNQPERGTTYWDFSLYPISDATQTMVGLVLTMADVTARIRMEEQLRASELRYRTVANYTYDWEYWEKPDGTWAYCSPSCLRVTGHYPEEFLNQKGLLDSLVCDEDRPTWEQYRDEVQQSSVPREVDFRIRKLDGRICWLTQRCAPVTADDGAHLGWRASTRDITDRKHNELQLRTQAELLNLSPVSVSVYDEHGRFSYVNQMALKLHGYTREEYFNLTVPELRAQESASLFAEQLQTLRQEGSLNFQTQHHRKDGELITLWTAAKATRLDGQLMVLSVATDITERERAANTLAQSESTLRALFEAVEESVFLVDPTGEVVTCNNIAATRLGATPSSMIGHSIFEFIPAELRKSRRKLLNEAVSTSRIVHFEDIRDGRYLEHSVYPVTDQTGKVERAAIFARDTTERHIAENRLRKTNDLLLSLRESQSQFMNTGDPQPVYSTLLDALVELSQSTFGFLERTAATPGSLPLALVSLTDGNKTPLIRAQLTTAFTPLKKLNGANTAQPIIGGKHTTNGSLDDFIDSFLGIPLVYGGQVVGIVGLANRPGGFDASLVDTLAPFTSTCAATIHAVETMQLYREQRAILHDTEEAKRAIVETVPGVVYRIALGSVWQVVHTTAGVFSVTGYPVEEVCSSGFNWRALILPEDVPHLLEVFQNVVRTDQPGEVEFRLRDKSGEVHWLHTKCQVTHTGSDQPDYLDGVAIDISERRRAQNALIAKTEELERYFNVSLDLLCIADLDGHFRRLNPAWTQILGYPVVKLEGTNLLELVHPDDIPSTLQALAQLAKQVPVLALTNRCRHTDGSYRSIEWRAYPSETAIYAAARDVTVRGLTELALKESESRYRILIENTPDVVTHFDATGRLLYVSPSICQVSDFSAKQLVGKTYVEAGFPVEEAKLWQARIERVVATGKPDEAEINFESARHGTVILNWRLFPVREQSGTRTVLSLARNVTEQKRLEREYQALFNEMLNGLAVHEVLGNDSNSPENFRLVAANPAFERMTGLYGEDLLGKTLRDVLPNTDPRWLGIYGQVAATGTPAHFEAHLTDLGRLFEVTAFRTAPRQVACIYTDISERRRLQEQYHQSAKLEAIGRLASGVAHDLNNLLMPILGYSEVALEMTAPDDSRLVPLKEIRTAGQQAKGLVRQLLAFGQKQHLDFQQVDLNTVVSGFALLLDRALRENIRFSLITAPTPLWVSADVGQLELVLMTLAVNAQESMPSGGTLTIEVLPSEHPVTVKQHDSQPPPAEACLLVRDDGPGLDLNTRERLFEPFFTTQTLSQSAYLGLSAVHTIIVQHGGSIAVQSAPGLGTEFVILLPLVLGVVHSEFSSESPPPTSQAHVSGAILVVEDNPLVRDLTVRALETQGYKVRSACNAKECLSKLDDWNERFDLLLTDLVMPDMNGKALYEVLSAHYLGLKVAYMSGYSQGFITQQHGLSPDVTFLQKPFSMRKLLTTLHQLLTQTPQRD